MPATAGQCPRCKEHLKRHARHALHALPSGAAASNGRYRLDYPLELGDFGITYRAWDMEAEQLVALREYFPRCSARRQQSDGRVIPTPSEQHVYARAVPQFEDVRRELERYWSKVLDAAAVLDTFRERNTAYRVTKFVAPWRSLRDN